MSGNRRILIGVFGLSNWVYRIFGIAFAINKTAGETA